MKTYRTERAERRTDKDILDQKIKQKTRIKNKKKERKEKKERKN